MAFIGAGFGLLPHTTPRHNPSVNAPAVLMSLHFQHVRSQIARWGGQPRPWPARAACTRWPGARPKRPRCWRAWPDRLVFQLAWHLPGRGLRWACLRLRSSTAGFGSKWCKLIPIGAFGAAQHQSGCWRPGCAALELGYTLCVEWHWQLSVKPQLEDSDASSFCAHRTQPCRWLALWYFCVRC